MELTKTLCVRVARKWQGLEELVYVSSFEKEDLTVVRITLWRRIPEALA